MSTADELARSLAAYRSIFDHVSEAIFIQGADGRFIEVNQRAEAMFGLPRAQLIGYTPADLSAGQQNDLDAIERAILAALNGTPQCFEFWGRRACGTIFPVEVRLHVGDYFGQAVVIASVLDITARKAAEAHQQLAASVFDHAHEGIMITDPGGRIVDVNATFCQLTGYSREEAIGQSTALLKSGHHDAEFYDRLWQTLSNTGFWRGEVWNRKKSGEIFVELLTISSVRTPDNRVTHYVAIFSDITLIKQHQQRLEHLAHFDALTQLPNRMLLGDRMQLAMAHSARKGQVLAICYLDLDGFKPVNDAYGHAIGDRLLIEVAHRLKASVREGDTVARLGGDEFVLLLTDLADVHECDLAINRVTQALGRPFFATGQPLTLSASIGVTLYPQDGADADTLLRHADQAMYIAKQAGRKRYHLFDPEHDRRARARREELARIQAGLRQGEFVLHYQPKVNMRQGIVIGAEALIRWQHPNHGLLLPENFLPVIGGSELSIELGDWVIDQALAQLNTWQQQGVHTSLSINIAGEHLLHPEFVSRLSAALSRYPDVAPSRLELEILETAALEDIAAVAELFEACRRLGIRFALDDFGTGYSSLTYFRRLPADTLKIDQSFIRDMLDDPDDLAIVEGVIGLTQAFQRKVIAEGVETVEHGLVLLLLGCDMAQGFGIARPMPADALPGWIAQFQPDALWGSATAFRWSREDLPMLIAEVEHLRWMKALQAVLDNPALTASCPPLDHRQCRFGRWLHSAASSRYAAVDAFERLKSIHIELHATGRRLVEARDQLSQDEHADLQQRLTEHSQALEDCLQQIQAEIVLMA